VSHLFHQVEEDVEEWSRLAVKVAAQLVRNLCLVTAPKTINSRLKYLELVSLQDRLVLGIFVLEGARIKRQLITFDRIVTQTELAAIASRLNAIYSGLNWAEITAKADELSSVEEQVRDYLVRILQAEEAQEYEEPYLDGLHLMLGQPEFNQGEPPRSLLELVDERRLVKTITPEGLSNQRVRVIIGSENKAEAVQGYSVVISGYGMPGAAVGTIGVIGPMRMPYARTIATISYLAAALSQLTRELYGREDTDN
jgi:heat-inducible transcriptional repressor